MGWNREGYRGAAGSSGPRGGREGLGQDRVGPRALAFGLESEDQTVAQRRRRQRGKVLLRDEESAREQRARLRREQERLPAARARAEADEPADDRRRGRVSGMRREDEPR